MFLKEEEEEEEEDPAHAMEVNAVASWRRSRDGNHQPLSAPLSLFERGPAMRPGERQAKAPATLLILSTSRRCRRAGERIQLVHIAGTLADGALRDVCVRIRRR